MLHSIAKFVWSSNQKLCFEYTTYIFQRRTSGNIYIFDYLPGTKICQYVLLYVTTGLQDRCDVRLKSGEFFRKPNIILDTKLFSTNAQLECVTEKKEDNKNYQSVCKAVLAPNRRTDPSIYEDWIYRTTQAIPDMLVLVRHNKNMY